MSFYNAESGLNMFISKLNLMLNDPNIDNDTIIPNNDSTINLDIYNNDDVLYEVINFELVDDIKNIYTVEVLGNSSSNFNNIQNKLKIEFSINKKPIPEFSFGILSDGDIKFNGRNDSYGVFWINGVMKWNGSGFINGSVVAGNNITRNGVFNFVVNDNISNNNIPTSIKAYIISWEDEKMI